MFLEVKEIVVDGWVSEEWCVGGGCCLFSIDVAAQLTQVPVI